MSPYKELFVSIIVGSDSDLYIIKESESIFQCFNINYEIQILSAHRTPKALIEYLNTLNANVIIAAAGLSAHLPGVIAAHTIIPVIGIPIPSGELKGLDSLLSIVQMPPHVPVATMGIGIPGAKNAALFAIQILSQKEEILKEKLIEYRKMIETEVLQKNKALRKNS